MGLDTNARKGGRNSRKGGGGGAKGLLLGINSTKKQPRPILDCTVLYYICCSVALISAMGRMIELKLALVVDIFEHESGSFLSLSQGRSWHVWAAAAAAAVDAGAVDWCTDIMWK